MASNVTGFKYGSGVGQASYNNIIALARKSGIPFNVTATTNGVHVAGSYHYSGNAVDMSGSIANMDKLAQYFMQFSGEILELIHSDNSVPGQGYFVHNGQVVGKDVYAAVFANHFNHVHVAMTNSGVSAAEGANIGAFNAQPAGFCIPIGPPIPLGPLKPQCINPTDPLGAIGSVLDEVKGFFDLVTNPSTWKRLGFIVGGMILVIMGIVLLATSSGTVKGSLKEAATKVKKVAP